jgi:hypothetical protein
MSEEPPSFPQYPPPDNPGLQVAERKQSDPLWKLAKMMLKPHRKLEKVPFSKKHPKKKTKFY